MSWQTQLHPAPNPSWRRTPTLHQLSNRGSQNGFPCDTVGFPDCFFFLFSFFRGVKRGGKIDGNKTAKSEIISCSRSALLYGERLVWSVLLKGRKESEAR